MKTIKQVPFFNYPAITAPHEEEIIGVIRDVMRRGAYILQRDLEEFEQQARDYLGVKHFIGVADGTNALILALQAAGIGAGDEVIVPSHTYVASAASIHLVGATPVLCECGPDHLIDPDSARGMLRKKTRAIMPVHLNGRTCNMDPILAMAAEFGLEIIEDAAQAFGSRFKGKAAGSFGAAGTISFYPAKVLGCLGDGGGVLTNRDDIAERVMMLRDHGRNKDGEMMMWGTNARLDNLQAAILLFKLKRFPAEIKRRREIAQRYHGGLSSLTTLNLPPPPEEHGDHFDIYQNYELQADRRDDLRKYLQDNGIKTLIQWGGTAVHQISALGFAAKLPVTDRLFTRCLMLPMNTSLSNDDVDYVIENVKQFYQNR